VDTRRLIERAGIPVGVISGGATSTYAITGVMEGFDELQAGTYVTMDCAYRRVNPEFEQALTVLTRVISRPKPGVSVLDVGVKGAGHEFGLPEIKGHPEIEIPFFKAEEHCVIKNTPDWPIGQPVELIPSHACTTCNLYRQFHVHEQGRVVEVWPIEASGLLT
jgi:D-serine deaminase-like pyridoxal phosphate-dependent protein